MGATVMLGGGTAIVGLAGAGSALGVVAGGAGATAGGVEGIAEGVADVGGAGSRAGGADAAPADGAEPSVELPREPAAPGLAAALAAFPPGAGMLKLGGATVVVPKIGSLVCAPAVPLPTMPAAHATHSQHFMA